MRLLVSWAFWPVLRVVYILYSSFSHFSLGYTTSPVAEVVPISSPARTRDGRVEPPECLRPSSSPARVKGGHHVFGSVRKRHDYSLLRPLYPVPVLLFVFLPGGARPTQPPYCTAPSGTTTSTGHHVPFGCFRLCHRVLSLSFS
jgi:hypothetical protein